MALSFNPYKVPSKSSIIKQLKSHQFEVPEAPIEENSVTYLTDEHEMKIEKDNATTN